MFIAFQGCNGTDALVAQLPQPLELPAPAAHGKIELRVVNAAALNRAAGAQKSLSESISVRKR